MANTNIVYLPCEDLCTTLEFTVNDDGWYAFNMTQTVSANSNLLGRIKYLWNVLIGKRTCFAEVICRDEGRMREFLHRCLNSIE